jgi:hypothetical protein
VRRIDMKRALLFVVSAGAFAAVGAAANPASAHHSFAATYFEDKTDRIEGELAGTHEATRYATRWSGAPACS